MKTSTAAARFATLSAVAAIAALLLAGCAGEPAALDQGLSVSYVDGGGTVDATVDLPALECSELAGTLVYSADGETADDDGENDWGLLRATATDTAERENHTISIGLGDGLWFISSEQFDSDASSITLDGLEGVVTPVTFENGVGSVGTSVDTAATATGTVECTSTR